MSRVFYRDPRHNYPMAVRGEGVYLYDEAGNRYLDGSGGAAVSCLGHGHPVVVDAIRQQLGQLAFAHTAFFTNRPQERLAAYLVECFGDSDARVYFLSGGSEANEAAFKLARQYWLSRGQDSKRLIVSRRQSYHGNTLGALSASGNPGRRELFGPLLHDWPKVDPCYAYRHQRDGESAGDYAERAAASLQIAVERLGAENIAAFIAETVVGATLGAVPPAPGYLKRIRQICDDNDILLILDEVMCGSGRCGSFFAFEQDGVRPDIVTVAKGLGGGYQPIGATLSRGFIHESIVDEFGSFAHGHTYVGHATACAAALAVADVVVSNDLLAQVLTNGKALMAELRAVFAEHPNVGDLRGRGYFIGVELVAERAGKTPADASLGNRIKSAAMARGLIVYPGGGTADGSQGAHILLAPPFICEQQHRDELVDKLQLALADTLGAH